VWEYPSACALVATGYSSPLDMYCAAIELPDDGAVECSFAFLSDRFHHGVEPEWIWAQALDGLIGHKRTTLPPSSSLLTVSSSKHPPASRLPLPVPALPYQPCLDTTGDGTASVDGQYMSVRPCIRPFYICTVWIR
jgi:hypothetical protein